MLASFSVLGKHLKIKPEKASIDNLVFWLHYRATFMILILCTILVCSREYIGEHIRCIVDKGVPENVINTFCFFTSTFTVVRHFNESMLEKGYIPHAGVGPSTDDDKLRHHAYYQWVPFMLFGQALLFYMPHYIWRKAEGGRVQALVNGLQMASMSFADQDITVNGIVVPSKDNVKEKMTNIRTDFLTRLHATRSWSTWLIFCEILNFLNVIFQVYITNRFLGGHFWNLGNQVAQNPNWEGAMDPLDLVFPKVTKCQFHKYGPSGSIQKHDALCVMALNVINEKIYAFLWFWFLVLFIVSLLGLIWRLITILLHSRSARFSEIVFSNASPGKLNLRDVICVTNQCYFADWLFLYYLAKNMDGFIFRNLFISLAEEMERAADDGTHGIRTPSSYYGGRTGSTTDEKAPMISPHGDSLDKKGDSKDTIDYYDDSTLKIRPPEDRNEDDERKEPLKDKDE